MMKRYLPVIFTIFAIIFTHGHAVAADLAGGTTFGCTTTDCLDNMTWTEANCVDSICKRYVDNSLNGITAEYTSCNQCMDGYTRTQKTNVTCGGKTIIGLYSCEAPTIDCTGKCNSCGPTPTTISTYYTKTINRSCEQSGTACACVEKDTTYSCSTNALQTADTVNCNGSNCSGCGKCPTGATCDGSETFRCNSGFYKSQNSNSCTQCPNNATCNDGTNFKCNDGFYKSGSSCASCPANSTCTSATNFTCNDGHYKSGNGCALCPDNHKTCNHNGFTCKEKYYVSGNICASCPNNATCNDGTNFKCNDGFYKSVNSCKACPANSTTCTSATDFTCDSGYYKSGNSCKSCGSIIIGNQTITATSGVGATSKSDCTFTNVNTDISEVKFYPNKEDTLNYHEATIKIKSCY